MLQLKAVNKSIQSVYYYPRMNCELLTKELENTADVFGYPNNREKRVYQTKNCTQKLFPGVAN